jgi:hypothetical protein
MSTGTGVFHSEYNNEPDKPVKFLQIWVFPNRLNVEPRYDQAVLDIGHNKLRQVLSPNAGEDGVWIYQDAWFHLGEFDAEVTFDYALKKKGNGWETGMRWGSPARRPSGRWKRIPNCW